MKRDHYSHSCLPYTGISTRNREYAHTATCGNMAPAGMAVLPVDREDIVKFYLTRGGRDGGCE